MGQDVQASMFNAVRVLVRTRKSRAARGGDTSVWMGWAGLFPVRIGWRWPFWLSAGSHTQSCTLFALCSPPSLQFGSYTFSPSTFCQALPHTHTPIPRAAASTQRADAERACVLLCSQSAPLSLSPLSPGRSLSDTNPSSAGQPPSRTLQNPVQLRSGSIVYCELSPSSGSSWLLAPPALSLYSPRRPVRLAVTLP